jgi:hypothetical protein
LRAGAGSGVPGGGSVAPVGFDRQPAVGVIASMATLIDQQSSMTARAFMTAER